MINHCDTVHTFYRKKKEPRVQVEVNNIIIIELILHNVITSFILVLVHVLYLLILIIRLLEHQFGYYRVYHLKAAWSIYILML